MWERFITNPSNPSFQSLTAVEPHGMCAFSRRRRPRSCAVMTKLKGRIDPGKGIESERRRGGFIQSPRGVSPCNLQNINYRPVQYSAHQLRPGSSPVFSGFAQKLPFTAWPDFRTCPTSQDDDGRRIKEYRLNVSPGLTYSSLEYYLYTEQNHFPNERARDSNPQGDRVVQKESRFSLNRAESGTATLYTGTGLNSFLELRLGDRFKRSKQGIPCWDCGTWPDDKATGRTTKLPIHVRTEPAGRKGQNSEYWVDGDVQRSLMGNTLICIRNILMVMTRSTTQKRLFRPPTRIGHIDPRLL
ncbi:unnamed protein product, partial [Nesidiocoris tenuis]